MFYFTCNKSRIYESFTFWNVTIKKRTLSRYSHFLRSICLCVCVCVCVCVCYMIKKSGFSFQTFESYIYPFTIYRKLYIDTHKNKKYWCRYAAILTYSLVCEKPQDPAETSLNTFYWFPTSKGHNKKSNVFSHGERAEKPRCEIWLWCLCHCARKTKQALTNVISPLFPIKGQILTHKRATRESHTHILLLIMKMMTYLHL